MTDPAASTAGRFAYDGLDRLLHEKARLGLVTSLITEPDGLAFSDLKTLCRLTDGNLNRHLFALVEAGYVEARRTAPEARRSTLYRLTALGRARYLDYVAVLERVVADAAAARAALDPGPGLSPA